MLPPATTTRTVVVEVGVRAFLTALCQYLNELPIFVRAIPPSQWHFYNYPKLPPRVTTWDLYLWCFRVYFSAVLALTGILAYVFLYKLPRRPGGDSDHHSSWQRTAAAIENGEELEGLRRKRQRARVGRHNFLEAWTRHQWRLLMALSLVYLAAVNISDGLKVLAGVPRPNFLALCKPPGFDRSRPQFELLPEYPKCTEAVRNLREARRSFPSGHACISHAVGWFCLVFLDEQVLIGGLRNFVGLRVLACLAALTPAVYISVSRTMDYSHHWSDVFAGAVLGGCCAQWIYKMYYPRRGQILIDSCEKCRVELGEEEGEEA